MVPLYAVGQQQVVLEKIGNTFPLYVIETNLASRNNLCAYEDTLTGEWCVLSSKITRWSTRRIVPGVT